MDDEVYRLTPFGLLGHVLEKEIGAGGEGVARRALDALELHMRRFYAKDGNAAIILQDDGMLTFETVQSAPPGVKVGHGT